jgi:DNA-binding transcriptional regulator YdaS (Cro superfamily)
MAVYQAYVEQAMAWNRQSPAAQQQSIQRAVSGAMELVQTLNARVNLAFASSVMELGHSAASSASSMVGN